MATSQVDATQNYAALAKHPVYHLPGGDLFVLVEHTHFRVHRYFFDRESSVFRKKLRTPVTPGGQKQGTSEATAIVLDDVSKEGFARFLWVFYNPLYSLYDTDAKDWISILELAHKWDFPNVKAFAIRELQKKTLDTVTRISVYHDNEVDRSLLIPHYTALCERDHALTKPEAMALGMDTVVMIARARECARGIRAPNGIRSASPINIEKGEMEGLVKDIFEIALPIPEEEEETSPIKETPQGLPMTNSTDGAIGKDVNEKDANGKDVGTNGTGKNKGQKNGTTSNAATNTNMARSTANGNGNGNSSNGTTVNSNSSGGTTVNGTKDNANPILPQVVTTMGAAGTTSPKLDSPIQTRSGTPALKTTNDLGGAPLAPEKDPKKQGGIGWRIPK